MKENNIKISFFFRKPSKDFHSIEELFYNIQKFLPQNFNFRNYYMPFHTGIMGRLKNIFYARNNKNLINHITGDVNYIALLLPKKNTILTIHDIGSAMKNKGIKQKIITFFWFKLPLNRVSKITVISDFSKKELIENFKINHKKITIIPNCVSEKFNFVQQNFNKELPKILIIGTKANKNICRSIEAVKNINCELIIIGQLSVTQLDKLKNNKIKYKNFCNLKFEEVVTQYQKADILLFVSTYEGFGIPIIEAQASGIPVITSDIMPMNQISGGGALLVNPFKTEDIRAGVEKIISNDDIRNKIINIGKKNVERYKCKHIAQMYHELYSRMLIK